MTYYNLNGTSVNLEKFVSAHVVENKELQGFSILVIIRSTKSSKKVKRITSPVYSYRVDANSDLSEMINKINALSKHL